MNTEAEPEFPRGGGHSLTGPKACGGAPRAVRQIGMYATHP